MAALPHQLPELGRDRAASACGERHELQLQRGMSGTSSAMRDLPSAGMGRAALARAVLQINKRVLFLKITLWSFSPVPCFPHLFLSPSHWLH